MARYHPYTDGMPGKILVVDSDAATRRQAIFVLMPAGYDVTIAESPFEAQGVAARENPDLVLLGNSMTDASGLALVGRFFSAASTAATPVLVIADTEEGLQAAEKAGARAVLRGPVSSSALLTAIASHVYESGPPPGAPVSLLNDAERLEAVSALRTSAAGDPDLDRFTHLASRMLHVPASAITFLENDQQVFASQIGIAEPWASAGGTPIEYSYCQFAVTSREPLRIDDAAVHPLVQNSLALTELDSRAYVGIPLITNGNQAVGTLCVFDSEPRRWTDHDVGVLAELAGILTTHLNTTLDRGGKHRAAHPPRTP